MDYNRGYNSNRNRYDDDDDQEDRRRSSYPPHHGSGVGGGCPPYDQPPPLSHYGDSGYGAGHPPLHQHGTGYGGHPPSHQHGAGYGVHPPSQHGAGYGGHPPSQHEGYGVHHPSQFGGYGSGGHSPSQHEGYGGNPPGHQHGTGHGVHQPSHQYGGNPTHQSRGHEGYNTVDGHGGSRPSSHGFSSSNKPTFKVYCKKDPRYSLTVKHNTVVLAPADASDLHQHWYKDEKYSSQLQDEEGYPCFALVNKATNLAMKHSKGAEPVQLEPYDSSVLNGSLLWTMSQDLGAGYRTIRRVNNIRLNVDALHGDQRIEDGTKIVLWEWNQGANQLWKIDQHSK